MGKGKHCLEASNFIKERLRYRYFLVKFPENLSFQKTASDLRYAVAIFQILKLLIFGEK